MAGMATSRPTTVVIRAPETPGAMAARLAWPAWAMPLNASITPQTVPSSPRKGAPLTAVARMMRLDSSRSDSSPTARSMAERTEFMEVSPIGRAEAMRVESVESIVEEATRLAARGAKELVLIAQDITDYGRDLYRRRALGELLDRLSEVPGVEWLRVMYAYPTSLDDATIDVIARNPKVCKYIDMPLQHASGRVLRAMSRPGDRKFYTELMMKLREKVPGITLRTTFIVGYPGETE
ncbi:MAG: radical SAM protein, partial [Verrucomicrobia bacterium]|nr:radical SAM protein [Verrucomicrobiota bacterium]